MFSRFIGKISTVTYLLPFMFTVLGNACQLGSEIRRYLRHNLNSALDSGPPLYFFHIVLCRLRILTFLQKGRDGGVSLVVHLRDPLDNSPLQLVILVHELLFRLWEFAQAKGHWGTERGMQITKGSKLLGGLGMENVARDAQSHSYLGARAGARWQISLTSVRK